MRTCAVPSSRASGLFSAHGSAAQTWGIEASYLQLNPQSNVRQFNDGTFPIIARPFFNSEGGTEDAETINFPGQQSGTLTSSVSTELQAAEVLVRKNLTRRGCVTIDLTAGYRYQQLNDHLGIDDTLSFSGSQAALPAGSTLTQSDVSTRRMCSKAARSG